jgi:outer membrane receptor for ferrienterochelin and colicins
VRGFGRPGDYNTRLLLLVDGLRVNDTIYDMAFTGAELPLDPDMIERVEVVHGPGAALYGNNAFFGVVNVITRKGGDLGGGELAAAAASWQTFRARASYGRRTAGGLDYVLSVSGFDSEGQSLYFPAFDGPETNGGLAEDADGESARHLLASVSKKGFSLQANHGARQKAIPTASFGTAFNDPRSRTWDANSSVRLSYERDWGARSQAAARLHYGRYHYRGRYAYAPADGGLYEDFALGEWWGAEAHGSRQVSRRHRVGVGAEVQGRFRQDQGATYVTTGDVAVDLQRASSVWGIYAQDQVQLAEGLVAHLGARHDRYGAFGRKTSPRLGLTYGSRRNLHLKVLYGRAYRAPNDFELSYYDANDPDLRPETIRTLEVVAEQAFPSWGRLSLSGFQNRIEGLITLRGDPDTLGFHNAGRIRSHGLELAAESRLGDRARGRLSYAFQHSREEESGAPLTNSPRHLAKLALTLPLRGDGLSAGLDVQYVSARRTLAGAEAGSFALANLTLLAPRLTPRLGAALTVGNLLDTRYADPGSEEHLQDTIEQNGRSLLLKLSWRF